MNLLICCFAILMTPVVPSHGSEETTNTIILDSSEVELFDSSQTTLRGIGNSEGDSGNEPTTTEISNEPQFDGADDAEEDPDIVEVKLRVLEFPGEGFVRVFGKRVNYSDSFGEEFSVSEFRGLPYAEPPVRSLRFQRPVLKIPTNNFRAVEDAQPCPQTTSSRTVTGTEDCLYLNVFVPGRQFPVLVWFHGEDPKRFASGKFTVLSSGTAADLGAQVFLQNKIIVVMPQYRLGSFGFLSVANEDLNGNMGAFDQLLSLEWVQKFAPSFGGDISQITVMGQGSSATTIGLLATSEMAKGLFHRLILMSGSPISPMALDSNQKLTFAEIALQNSCPSFPTLQFVRCMQKRQTESIILADEQLTKSRHLGKFRPPLAVIQKEDDGRFLPPLIYKDPMAKLIQGQFEQVPLIIGVTSSELSGFLSSLAGKPNSMLSSTIFSGTNVLKQFIRAILSRSTFSLDSDLIAELATFEYFSGLNVTQRQDQAKDLLEEMISDYLFYMPAITLAKVWSRFAPVHFYVFDYVPLGSEGDNNVNSFGRLYKVRKRRQDKDDEDTSQRENPITQAIHGSDLLFLMQGNKGSAQDRDTSNVMVDFWINFIHKGSPLQSGLEWPQYREDTKEYLFISDQIQVRSGFRKRQEQFWTELIKQVSERTCSSRANKGRTKSGQTDVGTPSSSAESAYYLSTFFPIVAKSNHGNLKARGGHLLKQPIVYEDVSPSDISKRFYTFDSSSTSKDNASSFYFVEK